MEDRRDSDDEMSRGVWKEVENRKTDEARMAEIGKERKEKREEKSGDK